MVNHTFDMQVSFLLATILKPQITSEGDKIIVLKPTTQCNHKEADTKMIFHAYHMMLCFSYT